MTKRVLVTGGCGFIPSNFIRHLLARTPYDVVSLDALTYAGNIDNLADVMDHPRLSFVHGDIRDPELVRDVVSEVDVIVNAAAESHVEKSILEGASEFVTTNVEGTQILLDTIRETPVERFILISSSEVYGTAERDPMDEEHPLNPRSPYAATKAGGDRLVYSYYVTYGLPVVIVRPFNNYGPYQHPEKLIPLIVLNALAGDRLPVYGDGRNVRNWIYVEDFARAVGTVLEAGHPGEAYNAGGPDELPNLAVVRRVLALTGRDEGLIDFVGDRQGHDRRYSLSSDKVRALGWAPRTRFFEGLARTVAWYRESAWWWESIRSGEYRAYYERLYGRALR
jgi:dTDP-glucose 4,6-dehydratase